MRNTFLDYRSRVHHNREVFLLNHSALMNAYLLIDNNFESLIRIPQTGRDRNGHSHVSLIPFILLLRRQAHTAFDVLSSDQSYHAWLLLRPGLEAALIIGKIVDDPRNSIIWNERIENRRRYNNAFTGTGLHSTSLKNSEQIQPVLRTINDRFVHANVGYYHRHLDVGPGDPGMIEVKLNYFEDDTLQEANTLAFLHLMLVVQNGLFDLFNDQLDVEERIPWSMEHFMAEFGPRMDELSGEKGEYKLILKELGGRPVTTEGRSE